MATIGPFADLGAELPDPAVDGGGIDRHPALGQQIADVAARQRVATVPAHRQKDNLPRKTMPLERILALCHRIPIVTNPRNLLWSGS